MDNWVEFSVLVAIALLGWFASYFRAYSARKGENKAMEENGQRLAYLVEKGKNTATKEDVQQITKEVESIKADLMGRLATHTFRYQKEYEILVRLNELLLTYLDTIHALDTPPAGPREDSIRIAWQKRADQQWKDVFAAQDNLVKYATKLRPFYAQEVHDAIEKVRKVAGRFAHAIGSHNQDWSHYFDRISQTREALEGEALSVFDVIRHRVEEFDNVAKVVGKPSQPLDGLGEQPNDHAEP